MLQWGNSGDGCDLTSTLCKNDLRKGDYLFWVGQGCDDWGGKLSLESCCLWCRCAQYFDNICMYMAHVYFYFCCCGCVGVYKCCIYNCINKIIKSTSIPTTTIVLLIDNKIAVCTINLSVSDTCFTCMLGSYRCPARPWINLALCILLVMNLFDG